MWKTFVWSVTLTWNCNILIFFLVVINIKKWNQIASFVKSNRCIMHVSAEWFQRIVKIIRSVHNMWDFQKLPSRGVFLGKGVLRICSKNTGKYPCRSAISVKPLSNFIEITLLHGCSPVNLLHIVEHLFLKRLLLHIRVTCNYFMPS